MKELFPIFKNNPELVYLDNAATTQKPQQVIDAISHYYSHTNANIDGSYSLSRETQNIFHMVRGKVGEMLNVGIEEVVFVPSVTIASSMTALGLEYLIQQEDEILVTSQEHHSSLLPWRSVARKAKAKLRVLPMKENGELDLDKIGELVSDRLKVFVCTHISNVLGVKNPLQDLYLQVKSINPNVIMVVDGSQSIAHKNMAVEMSKWSDICFFSAHKMYGPTGIAVLSGKREILELLQPVLIGGKMAENVEEEGYSVRPLPFRLEAGTPNIADIAGLGAAIDFLKEYGASDQSIVLSKELEIRLDKYPHITILSNGLPKAGIVSFFSSKYSAYDLGLILAQKSVAVRTGLHCAIPLHKALDMTEGTVRISFGVYNSLHDVDMFINALEGAFELLD